MRASFVVGTGIGPALGYHAAAVRSTAPSSEYPVTSPSLMLFAFASGVATALAGRVELRVSPRPAYATRAFRAFVVFAILLLVPVSAYFYVFHGDWFLLYLLDTETIPSALALVAFFGEAAVGFAGFAASASLVRIQRDTIAVLLAIVTLAAAVAVVGAAPSRFRQVGTYAQFHGGFGLVPLSSSSLLPGLVLMSTVLVVGWASLLVRVNWGARRS